MDTGSQLNCVFCSIISKNKDDVIYQDDLVFIIKDIKPASKLHYLIISRKHIEDAKCLTKDNKVLVESMIKEGKNILEKNDVNLAEARFAFHWPPFHSVPHLHLHAIAPLSEMSFFSKIVFKPNTWWCVTPEYVLERISK